MNIQPIKNKEKIKGEKMKKISNDEIAKINLKELHKYIELPQGMYLGISGTDLDVINVFNEDRSLFKEYELYDYSDDQLKLLSEEIMFDIENSKEDYNGYM